jgi:hypothetical protein
MAADAAETIEARNSVEKMQAHQMALAHKMAMHFGKLAMEQEDGVLACKFLKASTAAMRSESGDNRLNRKERLHGLRDERHDAPRDESGNSRNAPARAQSR